MLPEVRKTIHEQCDNFNKEIENISLYQVQIIYLKNTIIEPKIFN